MKKIKVISMVFVLAMLVSMVAYASPPTKPDAICPICEGWMEAVGTRDYVIYQSGVVACSQDRNYTDVVRDADVDVQFECSNCGKHMTNTISISYSTTCGYNNKTVYTSDAYYYAIAGH